MIIPFPSRIPRIPGTVRGRALKDVLVDRAVAKSPKGLQPLPEAPLKSPAKGMEFLEAKRTFWETYKTGWWFGTFFIFPYIRNHHPNWLSYFSEGFKPPTRKDEGLLMVINGDSWWFILW